jgi:uncharacterized protein YecE (DUF72 family)
MAKIHIGTQGWSYKDWRGNFYPDDMKIKDFLAFYSRQFNTVEIDSTFYGIPRRPTVESWYDSVPADFKFAAKFPMDITHNSDLTGIEDILSVFFDNMTLLKEKLGPLLIQFPYSFKPEEMWDKLAGFLEGLPSGFNFIVEIRNRKWLGEKFYDLLRKYGIALALLEHPWMPRLDIVTSKTAYVRFLGDRNKITSDFSHVQIDREKNLEEWRRIVKAVEEKVDDFYGYVNNHYSGHAPTTARYFREMLTETPKMTETKAKRK